MCGFAVVIRKSSPLTLEEIASAAKRVAFRGPDNTSCRVISDSLSSFKNNETKLYCGIFHNRLNIVDHDLNSNQPFEDDDHVLVYNGEIYNYLEIRSKIQKKFNIEFKTKSDTEVLFYFLKFYGIQRINELDGIFAFTFISKSTFQIIAARDRFGVKPLYYYKTNDELILASEVDSIRNLASITPTISSDGISQYSILGYFPAPLTSWENVYSLFQGETIEYQPRLQTFTISSFLDHHPPNVISSYDDLCHEYKIRLRSNFYDQLQADCPIAMSLSGGIDSSLLATISQPYVRDKNITFVSVRFSDSSKQAGRLDESYKAETFLESIGLRDCFRAVHVDAASTFNSWKTMYKYLDLPFSDYTILLNMAIADFCSQQGLPVLISGDGADELHYGYRRYHSFDKYFSDQHQCVRPNFLKFILKLFPNPRVYRFFTSDTALLYLSLLNKSDKNSIMVEKYLSKADFLIRKDTLPYSLKCSPRNIDLFSYLSDGMMYKTDRSSMRYGVENRVPYLGLSSADLALTSLSKSELYKKRILRRLLKVEAPTYTPPQVKQGFSFPIRDWLRKNPWKGFIQTLFDESSDFNYLNLSYDLCNKQLQAFYNGDDSKFEFIWSTANLLLWCREKRVYS